MPRSLRLISSVDVVYFQTSRARRQLDSPTMPQSADPSQAKFELIKKWSLCFCPRSCKRNILVRLLERTMSLLLALDSAIQETEEFKRNEASGTKDATEKSKIPKSAKEAASFTDLTNSQPSTAAKRAQTGRDPSKGQTEHDSNDTSGIEILGVPHSQLKSNETLPPLPAQSSDPAVTSAMIKLSSMLAASDANPVRYMIMRPPPDPMTGHALPDSFQFTLISDQMQTLKLNCAMQPSFQRRGRRGRQARETPLFPPGCRPPATHQDWISGANQRGASSRLQGTALQGPRFPSPLIP
jgi:hypothetical protein